MSVLSREDAKKLIKLARLSIEEELFNKKVNLEKFKEYSQPMGVFVTLKKNGELRGCIGFPLPIYPLYKGVYLAAKAAAFEDPRFPPLTPDEYPQVSVELSVLTPPKKIDAPPEKRAEFVKIGKHGLLVKFGPYSGLLLPQVPLEEGWDDPVTFLSYTCLKAGLAPDCWLDPRVEVYTFEGEVWAERNGDVVKILG